MPLYTDMNTLTGNVTDAAAINNAITNILMTRIGSVPGKPTFGSDLDAIVFSMLDSVTIDILKKQITMALIKWEKRIQVTSVDVVSVPEFNKLHATIHYWYKDKGLNMNAQISVSLIK